MNDKTIKTVILRYRTKMRGMRKEMQILKTLFPIRLIFMILYVQIIEICFNFSLYDFRQLAIWAACLPLLMLPYLFSKRRWVFKLLASLIFTESLLNLIHIIIVKGPLTVSSLFVIANTNLTESTQFLELKLGFHFLLLLPYIGLFVFSLLKTPQVYFSRKSFIILFVFLSYSAIFFTENIVNKRFVRKALPTTTKMLISFRQEMKVYKSLKNRALMKVDANLNEAEDGRRVCVLVIGESANRNHLGLYGYARNTTPKFSARNDIFAYSDVITPYSHTLNAVLSLCTESTLRNKKPINESVSLLDIFYSAGLSRFISIFRGKQRYKCYVCGRQFLERKRVLLEELWQLYSGGKQTYSQLAVRYGCSTKTVQRMLDKVQIIKRKEFSAVAIVVMDTTYFGRGFGVMVFKNSLDGIVLYKQ